MNSRGTFSLSCLKDDEFNERQKKVFDQLRVLEKNMRNKPDSNSDDNKNEMETDQEVPSKISQRSYTKHYRGKESIFKKPQNPVPKNYINRIPDFKKNPHKWTKYSLEDTEEITDESNKISAMTFLKELADRKKLENSVMDDDKNDDELPSKIVFKKRSESIKSKNNEEEEEKGTQSKDFKVVMPEYVIGQKIKKDKKNREVQKGEKAKELKLDHLFDDDGED